MHRKTKVVVIDEHSFSREGLMSVLAQEDDVQVVGYGATRYEALVCAEVKRPDVMLLDVETLSSNVLEVSAELLKVHPTLRVILLADFVEADQAIAALQAGVAGYLLKNIKGEDVVNAIRLVRNGHLPLSATVGEKLVRRLQTKFGPAPTSVVRRLSESETRVLELLGAGFTNQQIAGYLSLSEGTVKNYVSKILMTLEVKDRTQAALWAYEHLTTTGSFAAVKA